MRRGFLERTLSSLVVASEYAVSAEKMSSFGGVLQPVDPRVKVAGILGLIVSVAASRRLSLIVLLLAASIVLAILSGIRLSRLLGWIWLPVLFFTGPMALPAIFLTPGKAVFVWNGLQITLQGLRAAFFLLSRAETAATLSAILILTTPWPSVLKALQTFRCPVVLVTLLGMTYRYIFVILRNALDMFESRKSRAVGYFEPGERRRIAVSTVGVLLSKSLQLSGEVHLAMLSRGFRGETYVLQDFRWRAADVWWSAAFAAACVAALWFGR